MAQNNAKKGVPSRAGDRKHKFGEFFERANMKKIRNILRREGKDAAEKWAETHNARLLFNKVVKG